MTNFSFSTAHSKKFYEKNFLSIETINSLEIKAKPQRNGKISYWMGKVWRWLWHPEMRIANVFNQMISMAKKQLQTPEKEPALQCAALCNILKNIKNFEEAVVSKHNKTWFVTLFFWTRIPKAPQHVIDDLNNEINDLIDKTSDLFIDRAEFFNFEEMIQMGENLTKITKAVLGVQLHITIHPNQIKKLWQMIEIYLGSSLQYSEKECDSFCRSEDSTSFKNFPTLIEKQDKILKTILSNCPANLLESGYKIQSIFATARKKIEKENELIEEAISRFELCFQTLSQENLYVKAPIPSNQVKELCSLSYIPEEKRNRLSQWSFYWENDIRDLSDKAFNFFQKIEALSEYIINLDPTIAPEAEERKIISKDAWKALKKQKIKMLALLNLLGRGKANSNLSNDLKAAYESCKDQWDEWNNIATNHQTSLRVLKEALDEPSLFEFLRKHTNIDIQLPLKMQLKNPLEVYLTSWVNKKHKEHPAADKLMAPWREMTQLKKHSRQLFSEHLDHLNTCEKRLKSLSIKSPQDNFSNEQAFFNSCIKKNSAKLRFRDNVLLASENRSSIRIREKECEKSLKNLRIFQQCHQLLSKAILDENSQETAGFLSLLAEKAKAFILREKKPPHEKILKKTRLILAGMESNSSELLFNSVAHKEIVEKITAFDCLQLTHKIGIFFDSQTETLGVFNYEDYVNVSKWIQEGENLLSILAGDKALQNGLLTELLRLKQLYAEIEDILYDFFKKIESLTTMPAEERKDTAITMESHCISKNYFYNMKTSLLAYCQSFLNRLLTYLRESWDKQNLIEKKTRTEEIQADMRVLKMLSNEPSIPDQTKEICRILAAMHHFQIHPETCCPISLGYLDEDVVRTSSIYNKDAHTYFQRASIYQWLKLNKIHPLSREPLSFEDLEPCPEVEKIVTAYHRLKNHL